MNPVEQLLSDACDLIQSRLEDDRALEAMVAAQLGDGQSPTVLRPMRDPPNSEVCIVLRRAVYGEP